MRRSIRLRADTLVRLRAKHPSLREVAEALGVNRSTVARHVYGLGIDEPSNALIAGVWVNRDGAGFEDLFEIVEEDDEDAAVA